MRWLWHTSPNFQTMAKKANTYDEAYTIQETRSGDPHGWLQWKGTDVCMDLHCKCGKLSHVDGMFMYNVKCCECGTVYMCNGHIELIEIAEEPTATIESAN